MIVNDSMFVRGPLHSLTSEWAPAGATGQTMRRDQVTTNTGSMASGTAYVRAMELPISTTVTNLSVVSIGAETLGTHLWAGLLDYQLILRAVSADNTGSAPLAGSGTVVTQAVTSGGTYVTPYSGVYWAVICAAFTGTAPTLAGLGLATGIAAISPPFCGTSSTGLSTPPALGTQFTAVTGSGSFNYYAWTS